MNTLYVVLFFILSCFTGCISVDPTASILSEYDFENPLPIEKTFLWKVSKGKNANYLFGTIHILPGGCLSIPSVVFSKLYSSKVLFLEYWSDQNDRGDRRSAISPESCLNREADDKRIPLKWLDTATETEDLLKTLSKRSTMSSCKNLSEKQCYGKIYEFYRKGDIQKMEDFLAFEQADYEILIAKRNHLWAERLKSPLMAGGAFIAVGVGHFTGVVSLLKLLKEQGFKVTRVSE